MVEDLDNNDDIKEIKNDDDQLPADDSAQQSIQEEVQNEDTSADSDELSIDLSEQVERDGSEDILVIDIDDDSSTPETEKGILSINIEDLQEDVAHYTGTNGQFKDYYQPDKTMFDDNKQNLKGRAKLASWINILMFSLAGIIGGILAWVITENFQFSIDLSQESEALLVEAIIFSGLVGACIGLCLGIANGIASGSLIKGLRFAASGILFGAVGGSIGGSLAQYIYGSIMLLYVLENTGLLLLRAVAWSMLGLIIGIGNSVMVPVKNKMRNGIIGGALGGLIGGAAFQQILFIMDDPTLGRALALAALGLAVGLFVSLVEETAKEAWLLLKTGPSAGKQFIVYEDRTVIGSNYAADIALVKDPALKPFHAAITKLGSEYIISPAASDAIVLLNGRQIRQSNLENGDTIQIGRSELVFFLRSGK